MSETNKLDLFEVLKDDNRALNVLKRNGITEISQIESILFTEKLFGIQLLEKLSGCGRKSAEHIRSVIGNG